MHVMESEVTYWTVPRPWRQPRDLAEAPQSRGFEGDSTEDTLYESCDGDFVSRGGEFASQGPASRRCFVFFPEPSQAPLDSSASGFRQVQVGHTVVGRLEPEKAGLTSLLRRWGRAGAAVERALRLQGWELTHWISSLLTRRRAAEPGRGPCLAWHPNAPELASVSRSHVSVHRLGDGLMCEAATTHLHVETRSILCVAWQPCDLRSTLAVASSGAIALWRANGASSGGWLRIWSLSGEAFGSSALSWAPDGRLLAAGGSFGAVHVVGPHSELIGEQEVPSYFIRLRRWFTGGAVLRIAWSPEATLLAALHCGNEPLVRLWKTQSWEVAVHVGLGWVPAGLPGFSLAWLNGDTLLATGGGHLVEIGIGGPGIVNAGNAHLGQDTTLLGLSGAEPEVRAVPLAQDATVQEVAVCPRTTQRVAVRMDKHREVFIYERATCGLAGWSHRELMPCGRLAAQGAYPQALAFAEKTKIIGSQQTEGSLLAVHWLFDSGHVEVRTYPFHYLPAKLLHNAADTNTFF